MYVKDLGMTTFKLCILLTFSMVHSVSISYRKWVVSQCTQNNVYYITHARSKIDCSYYCRKNPHMICARFIFKPEEQRCLLHSEFVSGIPITKVNWIPAWDYYGVGHPGK